MAWFRCFIRGENFPGLADAPDRPVGFYATRFVEADGPGEAETRGLADLRTLPVLASLRGHPHAGRAQVFFEEIEEVPAGDVPAQPPGLVYYLMDEPPPAD